MKERLNRPLLFLELGLLLIALGYQHNELPDVIRENNAEATPIAPALEVMGELDFSQIEGVEPVGSN